MKPAIHHTVYPPGYNKALQRGTAQWAKAFSKWALYVKSENMDDAVIYKVKEILKK